MPPIERPIPAGAARLRQPPLRTPPDASPTPQIQARPGLRIAAIVVTHNRPQHLALTLERLLSEPIDQIYIVDNGACEGLAALPPIPDWNSQDPRLHWLFPARNLGGAGGFALGLQTARAAFDPDWFLVMDDDARPAPGTLARFRQLDPRGWQAIAAAVHDPQGRIAEMNRPARNPFADPRLFLATLLRGKVAFHMPDAAFWGDVPHAVDMASFVGLFLSREALARGGLPDHRLFIYGDDVLYSLALRRAGLNLVFDPRLRFEHACSTVAGRGGIYRPLWKSYYHHRNLIAVFRAAAGPLWGRLLLAAHLPVWLWRCLHHERGERRRALSLLALALGDGLRGDLSRPHAVILARAEGRRLS